MIKIVLFIWIACQVTTRANADTIYLHTENRTDLIALQNQNYAHNLSTSTNLYALDNISNDIQFEYMTTQRSLSFMENNKNICVLNKIKTKEREAKYIFSKPINLFLGRRLYQHNKFPPLLRGDESNNAIDITNLFSYRPDSQLVVSGQISYGEYLDAVLKTYTPKNLIIRQSSEHDSAIINIIAKGRVEFALLFPQQVYSVGYEVNARSYEIEGIPPFVIGHIMCTRNAETEAFLAKIDAKLTKPQSKERLLNIHLGFINPKIQQVFIHYYQQAF